MEEDRDSGIVREDRPPRLSNVRFPECPLDEMLRASTAACVPSVWDRTVPVALLTAISPVLAPPAAVASLLAQIAEASPTGDRVTCPQSLPTATACAAPVSERLTEEIPRDSSPPPRWRRRRRLPSRSPTRLRTALRKSRPGWPRSTRAAGSRWCATCPCWRHPPAPSLPPRQSSDPRWHPMWLPLSKLSRC